MHDVNFIFPDLIQVCHSVITVISKRSWIASHLHCFHCGLFVKDVIMYGIENQYDKTSHRAR